MGIVRKNENGINISNKVGERASGTNRKLHMTGGHSGLPLTQSVLHKPYKSRYSALMVCSVHNMEVLV